MLSNLQLLLSFLTLAFPRYTQAKANSIKKLRHPCVFNVGVVALSGYFPTPPLLNSLAARYYGYRHTLRDYLLITSSKKVTVLPV